MTGSADSRSPRSPRDILAELIRIPSVNPMGRDMTGPETLETRVTAWLMEYFQELGVPAEAIEVAPGRCNVLARYEGSGSGPVVLMDAHQDTVPVDGMTISPFDPVIEGDRMYGRGSCDVKGGMAAMLAAFARLVREQPAGAATVVMSCTADEESTVMGVSDLARLWTDPSRAGSLVTTPPDIALVAEPTDLDIVVAHRGATRWKIRTTGRACHSSRPDEGVNAIYKMAPIISALQKYASQLQSESAAHPLCGPPTLSVGRIEGGVSVNTVPDFCTVEIDRRVIPGEDGLAVMDAVEAYLRKQVDVDFEMLPPWITGCSLSDDNNGRWSDLLLQQITPVAGEHRKMGVAYGTNASRIAETGVPAMVFGPGSIDQAHTKDEWISLTELDQASEVYYRFCVAAGSA